MTPTDHEIKIANATARTRGVVGPRAKVPRIVAQSAKPWMRILDYGAGPDATHAKLLRDLGFKVTAHEFGANVRPGIHDPKALGRRYDLVYASNVLNVQATREMLRWTLQEVHRLIDRGGSAVVNYPTKPRKAGLSTEAVRTELACLFYIIDLEPWVYLLIPRKLPNIK